MFLVTHVNFYVKNMNVFKNFTVQIIPEKNITTNKNKTLEVFINIRSTPPDKSDQFIR